VQVAVQAVQVAVLAVEAVLLMLVFPPLSA
jgi:hypothetical protein